MTKQSLTVAKQGHAFGRFGDGQRATLFVLRSQHLTVAITDYGGRIVSISAPDRNGTMGEVVLGFETADEYASAGGSFGALLGRCSNRIADGRFAIDGQLFSISQNDHGSTLHGGRIGFSDRAWTVDHFDGISLRLLLSSADGDQGFPGTLSVMATYRLRATTLTLELNAQTTKPTPVSLSAHSYFNLATAARCRDVLQHELQLFSDEFLPTDVRQIPTGERRPVAGTPFDFRSPTPIGRNIHMPDEQLCFGRGFDHHYVLTENNILRPCARVRDPLSGRFLEIATTQPGVQFYSGNSLDGSVIGRDGAYRQSAGFALEPQAFPNSVNQPAFPSPILRPGDRYQEVIAYRFGHD